MKKPLLVLTLIGLLCLSACGKPQTTSPTTETNPSMTDTLPESIPTESTEIQDFDPGYFPIPEEPADFSHLSGAGGWRTVLSINKDGTLTGYFEDSELGSIGDDYPNGTIYVCDFSAVVTEMERTNEYTYTMHLFDITPHKDIGTEWITDGVRYIVGNPTGIYDPETDTLCEEYILYLPDTPVDQLSEEFLSWWPYRYEQEAKETLSCYGILNIATNAGFFYSYAG